MLLYVSTHFFDPLPLPPLFSSVPAWLPSFLLSLPDTLMPLSKMALLLLLLFRTVVQHFPRNCNGYGLKQTTIDPARQPRRDRATFPGPSGATPSRSRHKSPTLGSLKSRSSKPVSPEEPVRPHPARSASAVSSLLSLLLPVRSLSKVYQSVCSLAVCRRPSAVVSHHHPSSHPISVSSCLR